MTLDQKIDMLGGQDDFYIRAYPELGLPRLRMADGPHRRSSRRPCHHNGGRNFAGGFLGSRARRAKRARRLAETPARRACTSCSARLSIFIARR